jgi:hypothetical protein
MDIRLCLYNAACALEALHPTGKRGGFRIRLQGGLLKIVGLAHQNSARSNAVPKAG